MIYYINAARPKYIKKSIPNKVRVNNTKLEEKY